ncbi:MAG: DUF362 domain-containing protein [Candidatus Omnitrophica bacterium]|nr:DUF362 domain-containing protein [Candidatus Omnitrophota bacterium]
MISRKVVYMLGFIALLILVGIDIALTLQNSSPIIAIPASQLKMDGVPSDYQTNVALVRSDESFMNSPQSLSAVLSNDEIIEMTRQVLDLSGDLEPLLFAGAKVTIKPNIVELADVGNGVNTDPRVVEGLIRWMEERGPGDLHYTIAEGGGGWLSSDWAGTKYNSGGAPVGDGFDRAGYKDAQMRLAEDGIQVDLVDADFGTMEDPLQGIRLVQTPDFIDFIEYGEYWIHEAFLDMDVLINVPVMKIHTPQITVCLKNYIGVAAGAKYGTYKGQGGPNPGDPFGLHQDWPGRNSIEREIIELASIAPSDYCLVDAIVCKERAKTASSPAVRRNMLIAGADMAAVDSVCTRLMGLNPDDVPHLCEASREGLGTMNPDQIEIIGEHSIEDSMYYFERTPQGSQGNRGHFGMNNRLWLLNSSPGADLDADHLGAPDEEIVGKPGQNGWTEPIFFSDDIIDFEAYYESSADVSYYAFSWIEVPEEQDAELWISHDENCAVWIGGEQVYRKNVRYQEAALPDHSSQTIHLKKGRFPLLVKLLDAVGNAPFIMNICRILPTRLPAGKATYPNLTTSTNYRRYEGTRVVGLTFDLGESSGVETWPNY